MEASHEKWFTPIFFTKVCWKPKKKSQEESSKQAELENSLGRWDPGWCHTSAMVWFTLVSAFQGWDLHKFLLLSKRRKSWNNHHQGTGPHKIFPLGRESLPGTGMLVPPNRAAGPGPGWALGWLRSDLTGFQQLLQERSTSQMRSHLNNRNPSSSKLSGFSGSPSTLPSSSFWQIRRESRFLGAVWHQASLKVENQSGWEVDSL